MSTTNLEFNGQFIQRLDIHERCIITDFIKEKFYSNLINPQKAINTLLDYEISEEKNNLTLNIFTKKINSNKKNNDITCQINTKSRKVKCIY